MSIHATLPTPTFFAQQQPSDTLAWKPLGGERIVVLRSPQGTSGPLASQMHYVSLRGRRDGGESLIHWEPFTSSWEAEAKAKILRMTLEGVILDATRERMVAFRHSEQLLAIRSAAQEMGRDLGINPILVDQDLIKAVTAAAALGRKGDQLALIFFPAIHRIIPIVIPGDVGQVASLEPSTDTEDCLALVTAGVHPRAYLVLEMTHEARMWFTIVEQCSPRTRDDAEFAAKRFVENLA